MLGVTVLGVFVVLVGIAVVVGEVGKLGLNVAELGVLEGAG